MVGGVRWRKSRGVEAEHEGQWAVGGARMGRRGGVGEILE